MKQIEIKTNKRLLIVEPNNESEYEDIIKCDFRFICKGSDLSEDIAYEIVDGFDLSYFVDYCHHNPRAYKLTALEYFISSIEAAAIIGKYGTEQIKLLRKPNPAPSTLRNV